MIVSSDLKFQERLKRWATYLVVAALFIAILVLLGWIFDIKYFIHPLPKLPAMNPVTAITFILFALSFFLLTTKDNSKQKQRGGKVAALIVLLIGAVKFSETLFRYDSKIDSLLFPVKIFAETHDPVYGHMSPVAALCFILAGLSLLTLNFETRRKRIPTQFIALIVGYFGLASFLGYIFTVKAFYGNLTYVTMAIHTGINFIFIALALLFATADKGWMNELTKPFMGSIVARRLIPLAVLIPVILGLLRLCLELDNLVTYEIGITFVIICVIISLLGFIFYTTRLLNKRDFESRKTEEELKDTNYFLNAILENIPDMIFVKDAKELRFFRFNKAGEELLGYSRNDLIGKNDYDFFSKEQADFFTNKDREVLTGNTLVEITEEPITTKNGERWLHTKKIPVRDENGIPRYLMGISEDITERRKVDEQIKQLNIELEKKVAEVKASEEIFSSLFYKSPVMNAIAEESTGKYIEVNDAFADFMGLDKTEIIGKTSSELNLFVHPEERDGLMKKLRMDGFIRALESQVNSTNGKPKWISKSMDRLILDGKECYLAASVDITERKLTEEKLVKLSQELEQKVLERTEELAKSEGRFRILIENSQEAIILTDENFVNVIYRSPSTENISGWTSEERLKFKSGYDLLYPDDVDSLKRAMQEALANSGKPVPVSFRSLHKAGHYMWLEGFLTNMFYDEALKGIVINFHDTTEARKAEEAINNLTEELRRLLEHVQISREEERKYIAREIHDELGQRLTALKIDASMMRKKLSREFGVGSTEKNPATDQRVSDSQLPTPYTLLSEEINSVISQIDQSIESVKRIATDLRPEILDHYGIIDAVKWQSQHFENVTGIPCKFTYMPEEINLTSDQSTAVYRTIQEALTNIARHAQAQSVSILIELDSNKLFIEVKDNGKGILEEHLKSMKSLGLIGIRERIQLMKGTLSITGNPGKGTVVSVNIPLNNKD